MSRGEPGSGVNGSHAPIERIAVIGMAGRFPGADNLSAFWRNLASGVESITFFSDEELTAAGVDPELIRNPRYIRARGTLRDADMFDAAFFGYSPREAEIMDPQHRVFLEVAWAALEDAGYAPGTTGRRIGVYAGASLNTYLLDNVVNHPEILIAAGGYQAMLANDKDFLATRVSYKLNLTGPSLTVQTACSTSLVAIQVACQALLGGQCDVAMAGGVSVYAPRVGGYVYEPGMILSPDGHCRAFDAGAGGTVAGEGAGVVVLKRLRDALADGDQVYAVILGAAINNDGSRKVGYTAPSVDGQAAVIAAAQEMGGVDPETISYVEAHGTATELGDPIEVAALTQAFRRGTDKTGFCALGSVKSNLGHLDAAAGVVGFIKTVLAFRHRTLPASLHFTAPNPRIDFARSPFYVNTAAREWKPSGVRRAGVSSFGIGGTNAHVVLEEAPPEAAAPEPSRPVQLLTLSARSEAALERATAELHGHLTDHADQDLADIAYTLHVGRAALPHRRVVVAGSVAEAVAALAAADARRVLSAAPARARRGVVFMFPGQGSQYVGMARGLDETEAGFRRHIDDAAEILRPTLGLDLREVLYPADGRQEWAREQLALTSITQPALLAVEHALARLVMSIGVQPRAMIGHSVGEYTAACLAGVLSLEDALRLVAERGRLMQVPGGAMLSVPLPAEEIAGLLPPGLSIAAVNGPALCAVSGPVALVDALERELAARGVRGHRIHTAYAFHSAMMEPALPEFLAAVRRTALREPALAYVSNLTGSWISAAEATDPQYWVRHLRQTVRFWDGLQQVCAEDDPILLELGPGHTLASLARQRGPGGDVLSSVRHPHQEIADAEALQAALGRLWLAGAPVDWTAYHAGERRRRVSLPTYPFERRRHWPASRVSTPSPSVAVTKRAEVADWFYAPSWRRVVLRAANPEPAPAWLIFLDEAGLGAAVVARLTASGERVVSVTAGAAFARRRAGDYTIDPDSREDYTRLVAALTAEGGVPGRVLHLGGVDRATRTDAELWSLADRVPFYGLLFLGQALAERGVRDRLEIIAVSRGLYDVTGEPVHAPGRAAVLGPCTVLPQEFPNVSCRLVDVVLTESAATTGAVAGQLIGEFAQPRDATAIAYRGPHRWALGYQPVRLEQPTADARLRPGGVYLITGGFGGIGATLARFLARTVQARLVLVGRSAVPASEPGSASSSPRSELIRELEGLGSEVLALSADVAVPEMAARVVDEARRRFGRIDGVVHAAGVAGVGIVQLKTREAAEAVLGPKVRGTAALWARLAEQPPDFVLLCSSITALAGGPGQIDYCAANNVLDAFARWADRPGGPRVFSVNWDAWQEVGMAVDTVVPERLRAQRQRELAHGILPTEGVDVFRRILASGLSELVVSTRDLDRLAELARGEGTAKAEPRAETAPPAGAESSSAPAPRTARVVSAPPTTELERTIAEIWEQLLGVEGIGVHDDFFEAGGHSLLATQVMARLYQRFGVDVPLRALFEARTIATFAPRVEALVQAPGEDREEIEL